jgi:surfactin synthase thioesterase subunit
MTRGSTGKWLLREPLPDAEARLFCFPFAGVGASAMRRWPTRVGPLEVCLVQPPGRENRMREKPYDDFGAFAGDAAEALGPYLDRPFAFFGHCSGVLLAYALLGTLDEGGGPLPSRFYVSSALPPHLGVHRPFHPGMSDEELATALRDISLSLGEGEPIPELLALSVGVLRRDVEMCDGYAPPLRKLPCPVTTLGWRDDTIVAPGELAGWDEYGDTTHHVLPGDSFTVLTAPAELLGALERDFARAAEPVSPSETK